MTTEPQRRDRVAIFDTTLRDGEQSPGAALGQEQKVEVAQALAGLGVDVVEAGFPIASPGDFEGVRAVARAVEGPVVCALARAKAEDVDRAAAALADAPRRRLHVFLATSSIHREHKLRLTRGQVVETARVAVARARAHCDDIEFSPEDASRTEPDFLVEVLEAVVTEGATTLNIPDTVGYAVPGEYGELFRHLRRHVRGAEGVTFSAHCHDDLGLALANTLAAVEGGARQVECTVNGIGERAGNCALEEIVMALATRADAFGPTTGVDTRRLFPTSRLVAATTGLAVPRNKAIVGRNAFAHEAGIHQHGFLVHRGTYEILDPRAIGRPESDLVLGKHSGRHALRARLSALGHELSEDRLDRLFQAFKHVADRQKEVCDADLEALLAGESATRGWPTEVSA
jgi:2-isopropylmalate synthase